MNTSVIDSAPELESAKCIGIPVIELAEQCGSAKSMNVVMLGFFAELTGVVPTDVMYDVVMDKLGRKPQFVEMNKKAFWLGVDYAKRAKEGGE